MNTTDRVKQASNPQEALLAVAEALDRIERLLVDGLPTQATDAWGEWSGPADPAGQAVPDPNPYEAELEAAIEGNEDPEVIAALRRLTKDKPGQFVAAKDKGVQPQAEVTATDITVDLPAADDVLKAKRREFAEKVLGLHHHYKSDDYLDVYAEGGPMWLYLGDRDYVMTLPADVKQALVADVLLFSTKDAYDMGKDILKDTGVAGPEASMEQFLG